jgi:hypothetical protein
LERYFLIFLVFIAYPPYSANSGLVTTPSQVVVPFVP